jgi:uncharacterized protein (UPF0261 family)
MTKPRVLLIVTQDTKEQEGRFARSVLEAAGCEVIHLDPSVRRTAGGAEMSPEQIAKAAGTTIEAVRALGHEGKCQEAMIAGALKLALDTQRETPLSGIFSVGGSMGTTLGTAIMRAFPYGLPKVMVSTMASGFTKPWVGVKDIVMVNAVTDISGLNSIAKEVIRNGALAVAGMAKGYSPTGPSDKPLVLISTLGTTEPCVRRIRGRLEDDGAEVMVFHSSGTGGAALDSIAAERDVALVLDLSLTEIIDHIHGGIADGGPDRAKAGLRRGIPTILAPVNADFVIAGPLPVAEKQFPGKRYHLHNAALTAVRTGMAELKPLADHLAALCGEAQGPVQFFVPLQGFSSHDSPSGHLQDRSIPPLFAEYLQSVLPAGVPLTVLDAHFNDDAFADAIIDASRVHLQGKVTA